MTYNKQFTNYNDAFEWMQMKNITGNKVDVFCVVPGREGDNYAVVDLSTAIELGLGYVFSSSIIGRVEDPWQPNSN